MRYVVVSVVRGDAGDLNNCIRKEIWDKFKARSSKLPAHFTIKAPFEYEGEIRELEDVLKRFAEDEVARPYRLEGYDHFDERVIFMHVNMSPEGKAMHDRLIDEMAVVPYITFTNQDGKDKVFHVTIASKRLQPLYQTVWEYVQQYPCHFECKFDNICIYKWEESTWKLYKEFKLK